MLGALVAQTALRMRKDEPSSRVTETCHKIWPPLLLSSVRYRATEGAHYARYLSTMLTEKAGVEIGMHSVSFTALASLAEKTTGEIFALRRSSALYYLYAYHGEITVGSKWAVRGGNLPFAQNARSHALD